VGIRGLCREKYCDSFSQLRGVAELTLPDAYDAPACGFKQLSVAAISAHIAIKLLLPEFKV
jgi:hypothetical protein